jgi:ketosteroid isomerase-like protein
MTDLEAIQQTINTYSLSASRRDWGRAIATFMPDAIWEVEGLGLRMKGHEEMRPGFPHAVSAAEFLVQLNAPAVITINGDTATAESVIREAGKVKTTGEWFDVLGTYNDSLVRTPQGWRFTHRLFKMIGTSNADSIPK